MEQEDKRIINLFDTKGLVHGQKIYIEPMFRLFHHDHVIYFIIEVFNVSLIYFIVVSISIWF